MDYVSVNTQDPDDFRDEVQQKARNVMLYCKIGPVLDLLDQTQLENCDTSQPRELLNEILDWYVRKTEKQQRKLKNPLWWKIAYELDREGELEHLDPQ